MRIRRSRAVGGAFIEVEGESNDSERENETKPKVKGRALRHFTLSTGKSAGRNSSGRITVFHRGGGSKR